ncbi:MAG: hypothetical protein O3B73_09860 [bacterium]|nr:hypothetical protein [bacterium]
MYLNPYTNSKRWLRGNLHGHTCCGRFMDVSQSGPMFASLGYDFMAITDHNKAPDEAQWQAWQDQIPLILIPGEENGGTDHLLELGVFKVTETSSDDVAQRAQDLRHAGGFVAACHPQQYEHGARNVHATAGIAHAVEIFNGLREGRGCNEVANVTIWDDVLTQGKRLWAIATDDFHCQYTTPGHGWVSVQVDEDATDVSWETLVAQLKRGAFFASTYPAFDQITLDGDTLRVACDKFAQEVRVVGPEGRILHRVEGSDLVWEVMPGLTYFRIEIHCGTRRAWSQPFYQA